MNRKGVVNMNSIVTWEYYNSLYDKASQDEFNRLETLAEKQILSVIGHYKWTTINESAFYYDQLKDCVCKVVNMLVDLNKGGAGRGLASVSNDGYSENYVVRTASEYENEIRACIVRGLSGTGLISAFPLGG
jgi:hypothetical protein